MEFVCNANYRGDMKHPVNLQKLHKKISNSKLYKKPHQLVVKDLNGTVLFFPSGKFRVMGCIDELDATFLVYKYTTLIHDAEFPPLTLQSYTMKLHLGFRVALGKMAAALEGVVYEPELFPSLRLREYNPASISVFTTGKIMVCGLRDANDIYDILNKLKVQCKPFQY
jgi:TATA-box binding protein (TBP) (component of TFIID and TFIIIB)